MNAYICEQSDGHCHFVPIYFNLTSNFPSYGEDETSHHRHKRHNSPSRGGQLVDLRTILDRLAAVESDGHCHFVPFLGPRRFSPNSKLPSLLLQNADFYGHVHSRSFSVLSPRLKAKTERLYFQRQFSKLPLSHTVVSPFGLNPS